MSRILLITAFTLGCLSTINGMKKYSISFVSFPRVAKGQGRIVHDTDDLNKRYPKNMVNEVISKSIR